MKTWSAVGLVLAPTPVAALSANSSVAVSITEASVLVVNLLFSDDDGFGDVISDKALPRIWVAESVLLDTE